MSRGKEGFEDVQTSPGGGDDVYEAFFTYSWAHSMSSSTSFSYVGIPASFQPSVRKYSCCACSSLTRSTVTSRNGPSDGEVANRRGSVSSLRENPSRRLNIRAR